MQFKHFCYASFLFALCSLQSFSQQQGYLALPCKANLSTAPLKIEAITSLARTRLNSTSAFQYPVFIGQYYAPFQYNISKKIDTFCKTEYCNSLFNIRPVFFYYQALNYDFGAGAGIKLSNKITSRFYWSYQISLGWFEGQSTRGIQRGINFLHLLGINYTIKKSFSLFLHGGHISNGHIFGTNGSIQDFFGLGLSYSFGKKF